ncbi:MAG: anhydro-N-acetylmuramic acid kinase [Candidatus Gastranaerophilales bacterium]|nr:anhydro-N-acetylmuramic acid kinase [Candidatus Gastranaerophilales bacterium]
MENMKTKRIIGLMSGTSCDSIDAGLCEVTPDLKVKLIKGINHPYPDKIRDMIFKAFRGEINIKELCQLNSAIGHCFADAANILIKEFGKPDLISSHGQTVYHYPYDEELDGIKIKSTLQIGENSVIAHDTDCIVVSNFREKDIANNGQGAPLVCFADSIWFKNSLVQNIGGISNVTVVSDNCEIFGFDNACGNIMIDYCMNKFFNKKFDKDGEIAKSGNVSDVWLNELLSDEYYYKKPPKTTGREYFNKEYIEKFLQTAPKKKEDIIATLTCLTAKSIAMSYERFIYPVTKPEKVIIGGGGAYNKTMMNMLKSFLPDDIKLFSHEDFGISNNFKEVMAFALLGYCYLYNIPSNVPSCTGADKKVVLGKMVAD